MVAAAEQVVDGLAERLAHDVPAGHLDGAQAPHHGVVGMLVMVVRLVALAVVHGAPQPLDLERIAADDIGLAHVLEQLRHCQRVERRLVDLPDPFDAVVRHELDEDPGPPATVRPRRADHVRLDLDDFQRALPPSKVVRIRSAV